ELQDEAAARLRRPAARRARHPQQLRLSGAAHLRLRVAMGFALAAVAFAPGLALGSFLNVVAARVPLRRSIVRPPSACMACEQEIRWYDNVPLVSWLALRGRCRHCSARIPWVYPAIQLLTAMLAAACLLSLRFL